MSTFYEEKGRRNEVQKFAVAFRAALFLDEGDALLIDAGTSLTPLAKILKQIAEQYPKKTHFTIMTHNRGAFDSLIDAAADARINLFQTGGRYDRDLNASFGNQAENAYENYHPKWVFIGQSGLDADRGLFCHGNTEELTLKQVIFNKPAFSRVIVSDFEKLGIPGGLCFGRADKLTDNVEHCALITNNPRTDPHHRVNAVPSPILERYERQVSMLSETHKVRIVIADYEFAEEGDTVTITLQKTSPPVDAPAWMGLADPGNTITIRRNEDGNYTIERISIPKYA